MRYKPDEGTLMSYLYGELDAAEKEKVEAYLRQHPDELKSFQRLEEVSSVLKQVQDKEVIAPPIVHESSSSQISYWKSGAFRTWMSIAASFLLILVAGKLIGPEISYSNGELRISFSNKKVEQVLPVNENILPDEIQKMINSSLTQNNEMIRNEWDESQKKLEESMRVNFAANSSKVNELMKTASLASQDQVRKFVAGLQEDNLKLMKDYLQLSSKEQNAYVEGLLVDFSKYLQEQRKQDLQLFQTRMTSIEKNTDQFKQETEQILASIIANPEVNYNKKVSSY